MLLASLGENGVPILNPVNTHSKKHTRRMACHLCLAVQQVHKRTRPARDCWADRVRVYDLGRELRSWRKLFAEAEAEAETEVATFIAYIDRRGPARLVCRIVLERIGENVADVCTESEILGDVVAHARIEAVTR